MDGCRLAMAIAARARLNAAAWAIAPNAKTNDEKASSNLGARICMINLSSPALRRCRPFRTHWLTLFARLHLKDRKPELPPVMIELLSGDEAMTIETADGSVRARPGSAPRPDVVLAGAPDLIVGVLSAKLDLAAARKAGLRFDGDPETLRRVQPEGHGA